jgi:hypothetical protein
MPERKIIERAKRDKREGKAASTQAGEFIREEMHHIREGKHGARSTKQAIAIGLSQARRAGVDLKPPKRGQTSEKTRRSAERAYERGHSENGHHKSAKRSRATTKALKREGKDAASHAALSRQAHSAARNRSASERRTAGQRAAETKGAADRSAAARKAARTRTAYTK